MATKPFTTFIPVDANGANVIGALGVQWAGLANGDDGAPYVCPHRADKTVQVKGTLGAGGQITMQGTNDQAYSTVPAALSPTYATLSDNLGAPLVVTAVGLKYITENPLAIRPVAAGDGTTNLTVTVIISSSARL